MQKFPWRRLVKLGMVNIAVLTLLIVACELIYRIWMARAAILQSPPKLIAAVLNAESKDSHLNNSNERRYPTPYIMFKGKPYALDHNSDGFRFDNSSINGDEINVAFFGGSTGYVGNPPIAEILSETLSKQHSKKIRFLNFSVPSSNHNQHLHSILEQAKKYKIDLVVFYGGYNETIQTASYDPRPGYPYNFRIRNELQPELQLLVKHSLLFSSLSQRSGLINLILGITDKPFNHEWNTSIVGNYIDTLKQASVISKALFSGGRCQSQFLAIYQPYQYSKGAPELFKTEVHDAIKERGRGLPYWIDVSGSLDSRPDVYTDIVHINADGNKIVAAAIANNSVWARLIAACR
ncbi:MAG: hypothetical protein ACKO3F_04760 [Cyanobium sp.]